MPQNGIVGIASLEPIRLFANDQFVYIVVLTVSSGACSLFSHYRSHLPSHSIVGRDKRFYGFTGFFTSICSPFSILHGFFSPHFYVSDLSQYPWHYPVWLLLFVHSIFSMVLIFPCNIHKGAHSAGRYYSYSHGWARWLLFSAAWMFTAPFDKLHDNSIW